MNPNQANKDLKVLLATVWQQRLAIIGLVLCLGLSLVIMFNMVGRERIVLTPPAIEKSFWVAKDKVSASYLEQMGGFMAYLTLDVSPSSIEWKKAMLLQYVAPDAYGALQTRQDLEADRLKRLNATTQFSVAQLVPDEDTLSVHLKGRLATFINGTRTSDVEKEYVVGFDYTGNRIQLKRFEEFNDGTRKTATEAVAAGSANRD
jgi:conjugal transfer pilus assembly protein TraE